MKKIILFILITVLSKACPAQHSYFNKRLNVGNNGYKIISNSTSFDLITASDSNIYLESVFVRIDSIANLRFKKNYGSYKVNYYSGGTSGFIRLKDSSYVYAGSIEDSINVDALLYKVSKDGDTLWTRRYGDTAYQSGWMAKHTRDGGFIITGQTATYDYSGDVLLIKTDSLGNVEWQKHYGGMGYDVGGSVDTCLDGGFLIGGYTRAAGSLCGDWYILKTDSLGDLKWYRFLGGQYDDDNWSCLQAKDGNYIIGGHYCYNDPYYPNCGSGYSYNKAYIVKLDSAGNTVWAKSYGPLGDNTIFSIKELRDGALISVGQVNDTITGRLKGFILKTNSLGDSLWYNIYTNLTGPYSDNNLYDITLSNDSGFAAIGTLYPSSPDTGSQNVWVLKVDSNGCEVTNCVFNAVGELVNAKEDFRIYPNPITSEEITITYTTLTQVADISVFNTDGKEVVHYTFPQWSSVQHLKLPKLASGMYFVVLQSGVKRMTGRFVKE